MGTIRSVRVYCVTNSPFYLDLISVKNSVAYVTARTYRVARSASDVPPPSAFFCYRSFVLRFCGYHFAVDAIELDVELEIASRAIVHDQRCK